MAVLPGFNHSTDPVIQVGLCFLALSWFLAIVFFFALTDPSKSASKPPSTLQAYIRFIYGCFLKPHTGDGSGSQQDALESFYEAQASVYDATRAKLLRGRDDMLALAAAQLEYKVNAGVLAHKPIWVDVGGGTGWNIERMGDHVSVQDFFRSVYLVDLSPSLCQIARARFARLGWTNVKVVCQDARAFRLEDHEAVAPREKSIVQINDEEYDLAGQPTPLGAGLVTLSYSLSMIPDFYPVIDSISSLLCPDGIIGVVDFYVQSKVDFQSRNYVGGVFDRHCMWLSRVFWRTWFEIDRVNLEPARRDYLEYKFGTVLNVNARNSFLGMRIPYYVWIGCTKNSGSAEDKLASLDAAATESPILSALDLQSRHRGTLLRRDSGVELQHSKAYASAVGNLTASLPLPASWYQNHPWRLHYDELLAKHTQFNDEYIYAFTWEDSRADADILQITPDDVILAITSAGDNIVSFALEKPKRIHAVDLNPAQNHLLELKLAAFSALSYAELFQLFGHGTHPAFRALLLRRLSPHLSSPALQFWLRHGDAAFSPRSGGGGGLYRSTGGSRHALRLAALLVRALGLRREVRRLCGAETLAAQRDVWSKGWLRRVLLSRALVWAVVGSRGWLWRALGVPAAQRELIERDYRELCCAPSSSSSSSSSATSSEASSSTSDSAAAIHAYLAATLDPIARNSHLRDCNHYYALCLQGHYAPHNCPAYLAPKAHAALSPCSSLSHSTGSSPKGPSSVNGPSFVEGSSSSPLDILRLHTDTLAAVAAQLPPASLTIAVVMDSMDWFSDTNPVDQRAAKQQVAALHRALRPGGRVLLRSAGLRPWYLALFEKKGFRNERVGVRMPGGEGVLDRVNMYASVWVCVRL